MCNVYDRLFYKVGQKYSVENANTDESESCSVGLHVATLPWIFDNWCRGYKLLVVEFTANDIACIPADGSGKIRLHRFKVVEEVDPKEYGLPVYEAQEAVKA